MRCKPAQAEKKQAKGNADSANDRLGAGVVGRTLRLEHGPCAPSGWEQEKQKTIVAHEDWERCRRQWHEPGFESKTNPKNHDENQEHLHQREPHVLLAHSLEIRV